MMKIIFFGDSLTDGLRVRGSNDAGRVKEEYVETPNRFGSGYVFLTATQLYYEKPNFYEVLNRGIGGDRLPQIYARAGLDVWSENPDVLNILIGANDCDRNGKNPNPTDIVRWGRIYRMLISDTLERCPNTKIMICEPYDTRLKDYAGTDITILDYAKEAKKIAEEFNLTFVPLQKPMEAAVEKYGMKACFYDGCHLDVVASKALSDAWLKVFKEEVIKE